jgi:MFS family permease
MNKTMGSNMWLIFALGTVVTWGLYGIFLHAGQMGMSDPANGRYKAFLFVGFAYFLTAVLAPAAVLWFKGATWTFPASGAWLSLFAGILGAIGAFFVLLALGAAIGQKIPNAPGVVMSIIFAGAPIVNAVVAISMSHDWGKVRWPFILGLVMAAAGGYLVTKYKPVHAAPAKPAEKVAAAAAPTPQNDPFRR